MSQLPCNFDSISAVKKQARKLKKCTDNVYFTHFECLNAAARMGGFENFNHANNHFSSQNRVALGVSVRCRFRWMDTVDRALAGHLQVDVTALPGFSESDLQRIVFVIPEFWTSSDSTDPASPEREHFRIDSGHFHRVTSNAHAVESERTRRYVLSFHLLNSRWQASIFDYGTNLSRVEMEIEIKRAVERQITETVRLYQEGKLDNSRVLSLEEHREMAALFEPAERRWALFQSA